MLKPQWFQILLSLADGPRHGLAIRDEVLERTDGEMHLWPAMLYRSLQRLEDDGLIREAEPPPGAAGGPGQPRFYDLLPRGRTVLREEVERLEALVAAARTKDLGTA